MRRKIIAGNWKMNQSLAQSESLAREIVTALEAISQRESVDVVVCPTFIALAQVAKAVAGSKVRVGAQDGHWENPGAFTGKVSFDMIRDAGAEYVILGHSEQRSYFQETDETVNRKVKKALAENLIPIVCIGETLEQREADQTEQVLSEQVKGSLKGLAPEQAIKLVLAYEPVWAIGTGKTATTQQAQDAHRFVRERLVELFGDSAAGAIRIQYGGSMKPENAAELLSQPDVDGGLIGGASLKASSFIDIIRAA